MTKRFFHLNEQILNFCSLGYLGVPIVPHMRRTGWCHDTNDGLYHETEGKNVFSVQDFADSANNYVDADGYGSLVT